ncbi:MAG: cbb3-type cytochrome c oxidase subunit I [Planctomycetes bacterium]|nr:cbb3-type cytochrome c oxidase subunit I [Planctomycetota bacterium]
MQRTANEPMPSLEIKRYSGLMDWLTTVDHKKIGLMYFWFTVTMGLVGGFMAGLIRFQLATPGAVIEALQAAHIAGVNEPFSLFSGHDGLFGDQDLYNQMVTMHASVMIFFTIIPGFIAFANYIVPIMVGARDMAFPKMNAFGFWLLIPAALLMLSSFFVQGGAAASGWTAYPPLSLLGAGVKPGQDMWVMGIHLAGVSSILAAINFIVTIANLKAPEMKWSQLPLFAWATMFVSIIQLTATPVLAAAVTMILMDRNFGTNFTRASAGGDPVLYQHIFWFYSHPAVYIMILPGFGAISHVIAAFSRKKIFGYMGMVIATGSITGLGFMVWAHHMFSVGMPTILQAYFMYASLVIGVPTGIKIFSWLATMWGGSIRFTTAMKFACGFIVLFTLGGFGGLILALVPIDITLTDTYFVVGHFHMVLVGGSVMLLFAMTYFWWPKMSGHFLSEKAGSWVFWLMFIGVFMAFFAMHLSGANGMARRVPVYYADFKFSNYLTTVGYLLTFASSLIFFIDLIVSYRRPKITVDDPWNINDVQQGFEWATSCPPPVYNFVKVPPIPVADQMGHH